MIKCEACREFYSFFATNVRFYLSNDLKTTFKSQNAKILPYIRDFITDIITLRYKNL